MILIFELVSIISELILRVIIYLTDFSLGIMFMVINPSLMTNLGAEKIRKKYIRF